jgi:hypothetical protein
MAHIRGKSKIGLPEGYGMFTTENSEGYSWTLRRELGFRPFCGQGKTTWSDGFIESGEYKNDSLNGEGSEYSKGALRYKGGYLDSIYHREKGTYYNQYGEAVFSGNWNNVVHSGKSRGALNAH